MGYFKMGIEEVLYANRECYEEPKPKSPTCNFSHRLRISITELGFNKNYNFLCCDSRNCYYKYIVGGVNYCKNNERG